MPDDIGGGFANALIWRSGGEGCGFNHVAMNAVVLPTLTPKKENHFIIALSAAEKCGNGKSWLCGDAARGLSK
jgi:hypothetical protein